jgi:chemotaxis protein MotB
METPHGKAPIIIVRKKAKGHAGHHGGAWKVAYADFVTAMMALFIVLWLLNSDEKTRQAVAGYFKDPKGFGAEIGSGAGAGGEGIELQQKDMHNLKQKLEGVLKQLPDFSAKLQNQVQMTVTGEGLRIELLESEKGTFFDTGNARPTANGHKLLTSLAAELSGLKNSIAIEGHTDARPYTGGGEYSNWELSADRANAARRTMAAAGVALDRVSQVRGFADRQLKWRDKPDDPGNRRISLVVQYLDNPAGNTPSAARTAAAASHH